MFTVTGRSVNGPGYGIYVQSKKLQTVVSCNNAVTAAGDGFPPVLVAWRACFT